MDRIECSNPNCYSLNPETQRFCQVCGTPLQKVLLWVPGESLVQTEWEPEYRERYRLRGPNVLLDGQPGRQPLSLETIPREAQPYLRLFPWRLHLPQVYGVMPVGGQPRLVLSHVPLLPEECGTSALPGQPVQLLGKAWEKATGFRQLSWLWQIARLWPLLSYQQVAGSLLRPQLLRVEGPVFRLRELVSDGGEATLAQLGELLSRLVPLTQPSVRGLMEQLCEGMMQKQITSAESWLGNVQTSLAAQNVPVTPLVRVGQPAFTICDVADELNMDLIIIGCRGTGLTEEGMAESVSIRVINLAPCPVLVIP